MEKLREFFNSAGGKITAVVLGVIGLGILVWAIKGNFGESDAASLSRGRIFMDAKTAKPFNYELKEGDTIPVEAPSGGKTGYPAELCYWTKDGKTKDDPTPVLLNQYAGKPGPTFCPDCGRLVVSHNPPPGIASHPPPTQAEYKGGPGHGAGADGGRGR